MKTFEEWKCPECNKDGVQCAHCKFVWQEAQAQIKGEIAEIEKGLTIAYANMDDCYPFIHKLRQLAEQKEGK